jgi:hypothetical protein
MTSYAFSDPRPGPSRAITVHFHKPERWTPDDPVLMVLHGRKRNGGDYRDYFVREAKRRGVLLIAPEFAESVYPHPYAYNYAGMSDANGNLAPREQWLFPVFDAIFCDARARFGARREKFFLFGHSAGGQLVHRLATFGWLPSIESAIAANSGAYVMPLRDEAFPFGIGGTSITDAHLRELFSRPMVLLLGDLDVDPKDEHLPREPEAMRQGPYRFARGYHYYGSAQREAARLGVPLAWRLAIAPGVAHSGYDMAPHAARELFGS